MTSKLQQASQKQKLEIEKKKIEILKSEFKHVFIINTL